MSTTSPDRLGILVASGEHANELYDKLTSAEFAYTVITDVQGILQEPEICLLIGFHSARLGLLLEMVRNCCRSYRQYIPTQIFLPGGLTDSQMVEAKLGGAKLYVVKVERFEQI